MTGAQVENQSTSDIYGHPTTQHIVYIIYELTNCPPATKNSYSVDNSRAFGSMADTQAIEVIDAAAVEIADVVVGTTHAYFKNNTTSLVRTLNKFPTVTSPTKQKISGAIYFKNLPYYEMKYIGDDDNIKYIEFGSINKPITIEITPEDVGNLLAIEVKERELMRKKRKEKVDKRD